MDKLDECELTAPAAAGGGVREPRQEDPFCNCPKPSENDNKTGGGTAAERMTEKFLNRLLDAAFDSFTQAAASSSSSPTRTSESEEESDDADGEEDDTDDDDVWVVPQRLPYAAAPMTFQEQKSSDAEVVMEMLLPRVKKVVIKFK